MKMTKLIFPVVALLSLASCNGNGAPGEIKDGALPSGGKEVSEKEQYNEKLASVALSNYQKVEDVGTFTAKLSSTGMGLSVSGEQLNASLTVSPFAVTAGADKLNGTKEEVKAGVSVEGLGVNAGFTYGSGEEATTFNFEQDFGNFALYLANDNLYFDGKDSNIKQGVTSLATSLLPMVLGAFGMGSVVDTVLPMVPTLVEQILGADTRIKYEGVGINYPIFETSQQQGEEGDPLTLNDVVANLEELEANFNESTGKKLEDYLKVYTYGNGAVGLTVTLNQDNLFGDDEEERNFTFEKFVCNVSLLTDANGLFNSLELFADIKGTVNLDDVTLPVQLPISLPGGEYSFETKDELKLSLSFGACEVNIPDTFGDDYKDAKEIIAMIESLGGMFGGFGA